MPPRVTAIAPQTQQGSDEWLVALNSAAPVGGIGGPGRWLVVKYVPTALFSLKASIATSSVGKTLLVPTAYAAKMALVDAAFRAGLPDEACAELVRLLRPVEVRFAPPKRAVVTNTFVKIRQESRGGDPLRPYGPSIAYRELVHHHGEWRWAFDLAAGTPELAQRISMLAPRVNYVGKRGSFIQFLGMERQVGLSADYTVPMPPVDGGGQAPVSWWMPARWHAAVIDDFGPEASMEVLSSFNSEGKAKAGKHRKYVHTVVPLGVISSGPGFTEYRGD